jgi:hypothetical protein
MGNKQTLKSSPTLTKPTPISPPQTQSHRRIKDRFETYDQLEEELRKEGLESSNLIVGVDFTRSNETNGGLPFYPSPNLHSITPTPNLYQQVISIMGKTLEHFDDDRYIPTYGFGDSSTTDRAVFPFLTDQFTGQERYCCTFGEVLNVYNTIVNEIALGKMRMSGPTNFAPLINKAIEIVAKEKSYHILLIICDGEVSNVRATTDAIVRASKYPLSIIAVGVGKADFSVMEKFDDDIPERDFDNFQFVNFHKVMHQCENEEVEFARHCMMEIPDQYNYIKKHLL